MTLPEGFELREAWLDDPESWFQTLREGLDWQARDIVLFGRRIAQPRLTDWCADPAVSYRYSGITLGPRPWHKALEHLRTLLDRALDCRFNFVLCNAYRDGRDSMGWHADNERELGEAPCIASLSLGASRTFRIRPRGGGASVGLELTSGSLLVMSGRSQADYQHALPKTRRPVGPRINLTFRKVLGAG